MKKQLLALLFLTAGMGLWAETSPLIRIEAPEWLFPLREAVYEQIDTDEIRPLYIAATTAAREHYSGTALNLALSRSEFLMGRALQEAGRNDAARTHYSDGMRLAEQALDSEPSSQAWLLRAQNLSQLCSLGPWTFTVANGLNVERFAKNALGFDSRNAAAQHLIAARWVYAPAAFSNHRRGIQMMQEILENGDLGKDDLFNIYSAIGYAYVQQRKFNDARPWLLKAQEMYPTNKHIAELLAKR